MRQNIYSMKQNFHKKEMKRTPTSIKILYLCSIILMGLRPSTLLNYPPSSVVGPEGFFSVEFSVELSPNKEAAP